MLRIVADGRGDLAATASPAGRPRITRALKPDEDREHVTDEGQDRRPPPSRALIAGMVGQSDSVGQMKGEQDRRPSCRYAIRL